MRLNSSQVGLMLACHRQARSSDFVSADRSCPCWLLQVGPGKEFFPLHPHREQKENQPFRGMTRLESGTPQLEHAAEEAPVITRHPLLRASPTTPQHRAAVNLVPCQLQRYARACERKTLGASSTPVVGWDRGLSVEKTYTPLGGFFLPLGLFDACRVTALEQQRKRILPHSHGSLCTPIQIRFCVRHHEAKSCLRTAKIMMASTPHSIPGGRGLSFIPALKNAPSQTRKKGKKWKEIEGRHS